MGSGNSTSNAANYKVDESVNLLEQQKAQLMSQARNNRDRDGGKPTLATTVTTNETTSGADEGN